MFKFLLKVRGMELSIGTIVGVIISATAASIGAAGIPQVLISQHFMSSFSLITIWLFNFGANFFLAQKQLVKCWRN